MPDKEVMPLKKFTNQTGVAFANQVIQRDADLKALEAKLKTMRQIWETEFLSALAAKKKEWKLEEADLLRKLNAILKTGNIDPVYETLEAHIAQLRKESEEESCQKK